MKITHIYALVLAILLGISGSAIATSPPVEDPGRPVLMTVVKFQSNLEFAELQRRYRERMPEFAKLDGLIQKYYSRDAATGDVMGVYLWQSKAALQAYLASDLRKTIGQVYEIKGKPDVQTFQIVDQLR